MNKLYGASIGQSVILRASEHKVCIWAVEHSGRRSTWWFDLAFHLPARWSAFDLPTTCGHGFHWDHPMHAKGPQCGSCTVRSSAGRNPRLPQDVARTFFSAVGFLGTNRTLYFCGMATRLVGSELPRTGCQSVVSWGSMRKLFRVRIKTR